MTPLSEHFSLEEFTRSQTAVRFGISNAPSAAIKEVLKLTARKLEQIRTALGDYPLSISSGYRCPAVNTAAWGSTTSAHLTGHAVDFDCDYFGTPRAIVEKISAAGYKFDQLILEGVNEDYPDGSWVHISFAPEMRGQVLTMKRRRGRTVYEQGIT